MSISNQITNTKISNLMIFCYHKLFRIYKWVSVKYFILGEYSTLCYSQRHLIERFLTQITSFRSKHVPDISNAEVYHYNLWHTLWVWISLDLIKKFFPWLCLKARFQIHPAFNINWIIILNLSIPWAASCFQN